MRTKFILVLAALTALGACAPLVGAGAIIGADAVAEDQNGGDGLF